MNEGKTNVNVIDIDEKKVQLMLQKIILRERTNIKTKEKNDSQMVQMIKKMIEEEVECY
jgi:hypothetical protein